MSKIENAFHIGANPKAVFSALSRAEGIHGWWAKDGEVGSAPGEHVTLRFVKGDRTVVMDFDVEEHSPDTRVVWRCTANGNPVWPGTTLAWNLAADGDRTEVRFIHDGFAEDKSPPFTMTVEGWQHFHASLKRFVETGEGMPS